MLAKINMKPYIKHCYLLLIFLSIFPYKLSAHLLGTSGVDQYIVINPVKDGFFIDIDVHFAEIPTAIIGMQYDKNRDGKFNDEEGNRFIGKMAEKFKKNISVTISDLDGKNEEVMNLNDDELISSSFYTPLSSSNEVTFRMRLKYLLKWNVPIEERFKKVSFIKFRNGYSVQGTTCRIVTADRFGLEIIETDIPTSLQYPRFPDITTPLDNPQKAPMHFIAYLKVRYNPGITGSIDEKGEKASNIEAKQNLKSKPLNSFIGKKIRSLFTSKSGIYSWILIMLLALVWGAMHAFAPGHGKTIVGGFLIGANGKIHHALILGLLVTITHTAVVLILAFLAVILKDRFVYPTWLSPFAATIIIIVGLNQLRVFYSKLKHKKNHEDGHKHNHEHSHGLFSHTHSVPENRDMTSINIKDLFSIGISGGLVPCPAAIVILLFSWQLRLPILGLFTIISFSLGLAVTLGGIGIFAITGTAFILNWLKKEDSEDKSKVLAFLLPLMGGITLITYGIITLLFTF